MSRLEELIQELCPDGVEYKRIEQCCALEKGKTPIQKADPGEYPLVVTTEERKTCSEYQFDRPTVCIPLVSSRGHGVASLNQVYYQDGEFALGNILCGVTPTEGGGLDARFLYLYLNYKKDVLIVPLMRGGANVSLSIDSIKRIKIPVPPLPVQHEIVRILDNFTELTVELTAELTARKKQYSFYRNKLLTFKNECRVSKLKDVAEIKRGVRVVRNQLSSDSGYPVYQNSMAPLGYHDRYNCEGNKTFVIAAGAAGEIGYSYEPFWAADDCYYFECGKNLLERYLYHVLMNKKTSLSRNVRKASIPRLSRESIEKLDIPIPDLDVQQKIINVLDNFDAICSDLNIGLPAEIEARRKQYEYYRDLLLTFAESGSTVLTDRQTDRQT